VITICFLSAPLMESQQVAGEQDCMPTDSHSPAPLIPKGSSPCLQKTTMGSCPDQVKHTSYFHKLFVWAGFEVLPAEAMKFLSCGVWHRIVWRLLLTIVCSIYFHHTIREAVSVFRILWRLIPPEYPVSRPRNQLSFKTEFIWNFRGFLLVQYQALDRVTDFLYRTHPFFVRPVDVTPVRGFKFTFREILISIFTCGGNWPGSSLPYSSALRLEVIYPSDTSGCLRTTRYNKPGECRPQNNKVKVR
jgi:hypothetical protein